MIQFIESFNAVIFVIITALYFYQLVYLVVSLFTKDKDKNSTDPQKLHRFAAVVAARNESRVIGDLIKDLRNQDYPSELLDIFVVADNCTDNTAEIARGLGAVVYERNNLQMVGKGYALNYLFNKILANHEKDGYDGFIVFDADNLIDRNFVKEMNKIFDQGYRVITSYRNSKNYDSNWITAGYSLWFLREAKFLNQSRMQLGASCAVSGTGFLVAHDIIKANNGWNWFLLTEDIEFSVNCVLNSEKIGYCAKAIIYDEQPELFSQSWRQRLRWSKGFYQVTCKYGMSLLKGVFKRDDNAFSCYDMLMTIAPATLLTVLCFAINVFFLVAALILPSSTMATIMIVAFNSLIFSAVNFYVILFLYGLITTLTEWDHIPATQLNKLKYMFTFPIFIFTYVPISLVALVQKVEWKPIEHYRTKESGSEE